MDLSAAKKRKTDENGDAAAAAAAAASPLLLTPDDVAKILAPFTHDQLLSIVASTFATSPAVLAAVRAVADANPAQRKLFVRGLGWDTTSDSLRAVFAPFGDIEDAVVIADKATSRSKGFGFVTYRHIDFAVLALKEPSKKIDSRIAVANIASSSTPSPATDRTLRKIYVGNVPRDMPSDRLLAHFATYGEIEEGPLGFDKQPGKFPSFVLFVYKMVEAAQAALVEPTKTIDGHHMVCKMAGPKKGKPAAPALAPVTGTVENPTGVTHTHIALPGQYGFPGSTPSSFPGYPGAGGTFLGALGLNSPSFAAGTVGLNSSLPSFGVGAPTLPSAGSQVPPLGSAGYGAGLGSAYGSSGQYGVPGSGGYAGLGLGSSLYRMLPASGALPSGGYPESGQFPGSLCLNSPLFAAGTVGMNSSLPSFGVGVPSSPSAESQVPPLGAAGYGAGLGSAYGSSRQYGVPGSGGYAGLGLGSSLYRMPPASGALPSDGYPESGQFPGALGLNSPLFAAGTVGLNLSLPSFGVGVPSSPSAGSQVPPLGAAGYGAGLGSVYGSPGQYGVPGSGGYAGLGLRSSLYRMPPASGALPFGGYPESGQYPLPSSAYQSLHHQPAGSSPGRRYPSGGVMYPSLPPYY